MVWGVKMKVKVAAVVVDTERTESLGGFDDLGFGEQGWMSKLTHGSTQ